MLPPLLPPRSHLALKRGVYYYRRKLLRPRLGEVAVSLRTKYFREAQYLAKLLDRKFMRLSAAMTQASDLRAVLQEELFKAIERERRRHIETPSGAPVYAYWAEPEDGDVLIADLQQQSADVEDARRSLRSRDTIGISEWVDDVMAKYQLPQELWNELALGLAKVRLQRLEHGLEFLTKGVTPEIGSLAEPMAVTSGVPVEAPPIGRLLSEVLPSFIGYLTDEGGLRAQTINQNKATYRYLMETCGDLPVREYKRAELAKLLSLLRALPASYSKDTRWKRLTLSEIAERAIDDEPRLAVKTQKRHFAALGGLFKYLIEQGEYEGANPAHGFSFPNKGRASSKRQQWEGERLRQLFASPVWTGCKTARQRSKPGTLIVKDEKYWLPLLGLYHGNRLEEFAQLFRSDVRAEDGIWYLDINDEDDKQIKNEQSRRRVPIHLALQNLGFLQYVEATAPAPTDPLFPQLKPGGADGKRGHAFTKWWTRYRTNIGVYEPWLDYHSFRHGVTTKLFAAEVPEVFVDELTGHEGKGTSRSVYTKRMPLVKLYEAICKVEWPEVELRAD